jgi:Tfp pilus assembly protein PilN
LSVPVELFDPWKVVDTSALSVEQAGELEDHKLEAVVALGLATMACDPDAWSIEILPAKLAKRREFLRGPAWLAAAGVLALLYLGYDALATSSRLTEARTRARDLDGQLKKASQTSRKTEELLLENARLAKTAQLLYEAKGSGEQLARTVAALEGSLPDDFWLTQIATDYRADPELGIAKGEDRPVVSIAGRAREGTTSLSAQFTAFVQGLGQRLPPGTAIRDRSTRAARGSTSTCARCRRRPRPGRPPRSRSPRAAEARAEGREALALAAAMDLNEYWQENKRSLVATAGGVVVFLLGSMLVDRYFRDELRAQTRAADSAASKLRTEPMYSATDRDAAEKENQALAKAVETLSQATASRRGPRSASTPRPGRRRTSTSPRSRACATSS